MQQVTIAIVNQMRSLKMRNSSCLLSSLRKVWKYSWWALNAKIYLHQTEKVTLKWWPNERACQRASSNHVTWMTSFVLVHSNGFIHFIQSRFFKAALSDTKETWLFVLTLFHHLHSDEENDEELDQLAYLPVAPEIDDPEEHPWATTEVKPVTMTTCCHGSVVSSVKKRARQETKMAYEWKVTDRTVNGSQHQPWQGSVCAVRFT